MKLFLQILGGILIVVAAIFLLSTALGFLIQIIVVTAIVALIALLVHSFWNSHKAKTDPVKAHRKAEKVAEKSLKQLERKTGTERSQL